MKKNLQGAKSYFWPRNAKFFQKFSFFGEGESVLPSLCPLATPMLRRCYCLKYSGTFDNQSLLPNIGSLKMDFLVHS